LIHFYKRSMQVNRPIVHKRKYFGDNKAVFSKNLMMLEVFFTV